LQCSALAAISDIAEVMLVGHASEEDNFCYAIRGTKVRKLHTSRRDAFKPINCKPFAKISQDTILKIDGHNLRNNRKVKLDLKFNDKIALIKLYPGQSTEILDYYAKDKYKGIILELSGIGNASSKFIKKINELSNKGIIFCGVSQCINGRVDGLVYSSGRKLIEAGVIYLGDMLAETALVKLGWVLGHKEWIKSKEKIKEKMLENIAGEFNKRLEE